MNKFHLILILIFLIFILPLNTSAQPEVTDTLKICNDQCVELKVKKKSGYTYNWKAFGTFIDSDQPKIEVCPEKAKNLYYVEVFDKNGTHIQTHTFYIFTEVPEITLTPENLCILDNQEITIRVKEEFKSYKWSNGVTGREIKVNKPQKLILEVVTFSGCNGKLDLTITQQKGEEIKKYLKEQGFYSTPIKVLKKKKN